MTRRLALAAIMWVGISTLSYASGPQSAPLDSLRVAIGAGQYERAATESEALVAQWETEFGAESLEVAQALDVWADALSRAERSAESRTAEIIQRAIGIKTNLLGPDHVETAASLYVWGAIQRQRGELEAAIEIFDQVLTVRIRDLGPDHKLVGNVHGSLGIAIANSGRLPDALVHFERAAAIAEMVGEPNDPEVGASYTNLATLYRLLGDLPAAVGAIEKAIANIEVSRGPEHPLLAQATYTLATINSQLGDIRAAAEHLERARQIYAANDMQENPASGRVWNGLGMVAQGLGDYPEAQRCFTRALTIFENAYDSDHQDLSFYLNNLGTAAQLNGEYELARTSFERSVQVNRDKLGADNLRTATSEYYLANFELSQGERDAAETRLESCLGRFVSELGEDHFQVAEARGDLALIKELKHDWKAAEALLDLALDSNGAGFNPTTRAILQTRRARLHLLQGDYLTSCAEALEVEDTAADQYRLIVQTLSESVSRRFAAARTNGLSIALSALLAQGQTTEMAAAAWDRVLRSRGMLLDELAARRRSVNATQDSTTRQMAEDLFAARSRLADMYVRGPGDRNPQQYEAVLDRAKHDKKTAETALAARSAAFRSVAADRNLGLTEIRSALPTNSALVAYQRFLRIGEDDEEPWYCAFVLADDTVSIIDLGPAAAIDDLIAQWRNGLLEAWAPGRVLAQAGIIANGELGARLRDLVWAPCTGNVANMETVFVVPDGDLHLLPLAALPSVNGGYLLEYGPTIHYLSREKSLVRPTVPAGQGLLAFGDPTFDGRVVPTMPMALAVPDIPRLQGVLRSAPPDCEHLQSLQFSALPGTRRECESVAALAPGKSTLFLGKDATEAAFKASLSGHRIIHLATHGYFVGSDCPTEAAGFSDDPLLLAGLALAGANLRTEATAGQEDGIVTAEEISLLDLAGTEWAVLSACDTGLGVLQPGEGVYGLQRAFETAGVGTVIMSLWPVEDQVTQQWMSALYQARLSDKQSTPSSVRLASLQVLNQRRDDGLSEHPFWWAGFVACGDWH